MIEELTSEEPFLIGEGHAGDSQGTQGWVPKMARQDMASQVLQHTVDPDLRKPQTTESRQGGMCGETLR